MHCRGKTSHPYKVLFIPEGISREHHAGNLNKDLPTMISKCQCLVHESNCKLSGF